jgi:uncharacterized protein (TIGR03435 family)
MPAQSPITRIPPRTRTAAALIACASIALSTQLASGQAGPASRPTAPATSAIAPAAAEPKAGDVPAFDVASIRLSTDKAGSYLRFLPGGRFSGESWIKQVIQVAYGVEDYQVTGGPEWLTTDWYFIEAKAGKTDASKQEMTAMLKSLLADRFKLQVRVEMRDFDVYDLVVDKSGAKLKPLAQGEDFHCTRDNTFQCGITNPAQLARSLKYILGRPVMDKTGIDGRYDVLLDFDTYEYSGGTPPQDYNKPSLEKALEEQLGLRLVKAKEAFPVYVVESIERPTEN